MQKIKQCTNIKSKSSLTHTCNQIEKSDSRWRKDWHTSNRV